MLRSWEESAIGNNREAVSALPKRASLAQVMVLAFRPIHARRQQQEFASAA